MKLLSISLLMVVTASHAAPKKSSPIEIAKRSIVAGLKDPDSAKFRSVRVHRKNVCGEVNAKNSYGGYVGFQRFMLRPGEDVRLDDDGGLFATDWKEGCTNWKPAEPAPFHEKSAEDMKDWAGK